MKMRLTVVYAGLRAVHAAAPGDMLIVHANAAGGRSGDTLDKARKARPGINAYFLDANIKWAAEGGYAISNN